jgi:hypothetical protein
VEQKIGDQAERFAVAAHVRVIVLILHRPSGLLKQPALAERII